jgi:4-hydroxy 2-oxovalerate aldolase
MLNRHPQDASAVRKTEDRDNYTKFYNHMMND